MYEKYLSRVISETERLHKLTESMLTLNSLDARGYLSRTNFDINRVIKDTAASFEGTCESKNVSFDLTFSDDIQMVFADLGKIQQVMYNLIDNAIKFSHHDSTIYIQASGRYEKNICVGQGYRYRHTQGQFKENLGTFLQDGPVPRQG